MRYVIVSVVKGKAGNFNNNLRKEVFKKFNTRSSKLPAHFTIKAPFERDDVNDIERVLEKFSKTHHSTEYQIKGYDHFKDRVIFMKVLMSNEGKAIHDELIDRLNKIEFLEFSKTDGKDKVFHITITSKKIRDVFNQLWDYVSSIPCDFDCHFDNICIYKWTNNTWVLHKQYLLG